MSITDRSVLVVGGTGFIGRALLGRLNYHGFRTTALAFLDRGQAERLTDFAGLNVLPAASSELTDLIASLSDQRFDYIINLSSGGVRPEDRSPAALEESNSVFLVRLLEAVAACAPRLFVHAGSWSEYAPPQDRSPILEGHPLQFGTGYGGAKSIAERNGLACAVGLGIPFVTLRLFHVYGPGEADHRLTPYLMSSLTAGCVADLSSGDQVRDFLFVDDVADAFIAALSSGRMIADSAYNVCSGIPVSVRHVSQMFCDTLGCSHDMLRFGALPARPDEAPWVVGDGTLFEKATGWRPEHTLEQGLRKTMSLSRTEGGSNG